MLRVAFWGALALGFGTRLSAMMAQALAPRIRVNAIAAITSASITASPTSAMSSAMRLLPLSRPTVPRSGAPRKGSLSFTAASNCGR